MRARVLCQAFDFAGYDLRASIRFWGIHSGLLMLRFRGSGGTYGLARAQGACKVES